MRNRLPTFLATTLAVAVIGCNSDVRTGVAEDPAFTEVHAVAIRPLSSRVDDDTPRVPCGTCHRTRTPDPKTNSASQLAEFHRGLEYAHGSLTCLSCHHPDDYDQLRLADGRTLPFEESMTLCAQCHGPQHRDYLHGAHGGAAGYWDTSRGVKVRNHCLHCHDPHAPAFPRMQPTFKPRDRFLTPPQTEEKHG